MMTRITLTALVMSLFLVACGGAQEGTAVDCYTSTEDLLATEPEISGERLELLAVVRGLEALDQPSRVTLVITTCFSPRRAAASARRSGSSDSGCSGGRPR